MNVTYPPTPRHGTAEYTLLEQATKELEEVVGSTAFMIPTDGLSAEWVRAEDDELYFP